MEHIMDAKTLYDQSAEDALAKKLADYKQAIWNEYNKTNAPEPPAAYTKQDFISYASYVSSDFCHRLLQQYPKSLAVEMQNILAHVLSDNLPKDAQLKQPYPKLHYNWEPGDYGSDKIKQQLSKMVDKSFSTSDWKVTLDPYATVSPDFSMKYAMDWGALPAAADQQIKVEMKHVGPEPELPDLEF